MANPDQARRARQPRWRSPGGRAVLLAIGLAGAGIAAAFLGGGRLGDGGEAPPPRASGAPREVAETLMEFERALVARDYATICGNLFTAEAREAAGGDRCPSVLQERGERIRNPDVRIVSIQIRGNAATAVVRAQVEGGKAVTDTVQLARQGGRWRIVSAGGA